MQRCDVVLSSLGSTLWDLLYLCIQHLGKAPFSSLPTLAQEKW